MHGVKIEHNKLIKIDLLINYSNNINNNMLFILLLITSINALPIYINNIHYQEPPPEYYNLSVFYVFIITLNISVFSVMFIFMFAIRLIRYMNKKEYYNK